jgi:hypothetical protein
MTEPSVRIGDVQSEQASERMIQDEGRLTYGDRLFTTVLTDEVPLGTWHRLY